METNIRVETEEDTKARERDYIVKWMKGIAAEMDSISEQKAFMAKLNTICTYHGITLEELMQPDK